MTHPRKLLTCISFIILLAGCKGTESTISVTYEGLGKVYGKNIDCGTDCEETYKNSWWDAQTGQSFKTTVIAEAAPGYEFYGWQGYSRLPVKGSIERCGQNTECVVEIYSECNDPIEDIGKLCKTLTGKGISLHAVFVPEGSIALSRWHLGSENCRITTLGELNCWGLYIGSDNAPLMTTPTDVKLTSSIACAKDDSGLHCWGSEAALGDMPTLNDVSDFAVSYNYVCAIDQGTVKCWGSNIENITPIPELDNPVALWGDSANMCAEADAGIQCWGLHAQGQTETPDLINPNLVIASTKTTGDDHFTCALAEGEVKCWGNHGEFIGIHDKLVQPTSFDVSYNLYCATDAAGLKCWSGFSYVTPYIVNIPNELIDSKQIQLGATRYLCGIDDVGLECWDGSASSSVFRPGSMVESDDFYVGGSLLAREGACAIKGSELACWGDPDFWPAQDSPQRTLTLSSPNAVATNGTTICVGGESSLQCWSKSSDEQLSAEAPVDLQGVTEIEMNAYNACAIHEGNVTCWGRGNFGQLDVPALSNPSQITIGGYHVCALDDTGVVCWGEQIPR